MMTMLYAYCITRPGVSVPSLLTGLYGAPIRVIAQGALGLVVSHIEPDRVKTLVTETNLRCHGLVVETLAASETVLPIRFGTVLSSVQAAGEFLGRNGPSLEHTLASLNGKAQINVWFATRGDDSGAPLAVGATPVPAATNETAGSGASYLAGKLAERGLLRQRKERAASLVGSLHERLLESALEGRLECFSSDTWLGRATYLVNTDKAADFHRLLQDVERDGANITCFASELRAPYDFVDAAPELPSAAEGGKPRGGKAGTVRIRRWRRWFRAKSAIGSREH